MNNETKTNVGYNIVEVPFIDEKQAETEFKNRFRHMRKSLAVKLISNQITPFLTPDTRNQDIDAFIFENANIGELLSIREEKENQGYQVGKDILHIGGVYYTTAFKL